MKVKILAITQLYNILFAKLKSNGFLFYRRVYYIKKVIELKVPILFEFQHIIYQQQKLALFKRK